MVLRYTCTRWWGYVSVIWTGQQWCLVGRLFVSHAKPVGFSSLPLGNLNSAPRISLRTRVITKNLSQIRFDLYLPKSTKEIQRYIWENKTSKTVHREKHFSVISEQLCNETEVWSASLSCWTIHPRIDRKLRGIQRHYLLISRSLMYHSGISTLSCFGRSVTSIKSLATDLFRLKYGERVPHSSRHNPRDHKSNEKYDSGDEDVHLTVSRHYCAP